MRKPSNRVALPTPSRVLNQVVVADVNRDRRNDLVVATVNSVTVLLSEELASLGVGIQGSVDAGESR